MTTEESESACSSVAISGYLCFGDADFEGFEDIGQINILIGRNNSGKSRAVDMIRFATETGHNTQRKRTYRLRAGGLISRELAEASFDAGTSGGPIPGNHRKFGEQLIGKRIVVEHGVGNESTKVVEVPEEYRRLPSAAFSVLGRRFLSPLAGRVFRRFAAERDIVPEGDSEIRLLENGSGATNILQAFLNRASLDSRLVTDTVLGHLNSIVYPDLRFEAIVAQQLEDKTWEIFLDDQKGRIPLSRSGSGLKTIVLVLILFHLIPEYEHSSPDRHV
jgi:putative ATP-dependent endonuclease of OLD family